MWSDKKFEKDVKKKKISIFIVLARGNVESFFLSFLAPYSGLPFKTLSFIYEEQGDKEMSLQVKACNEFYFFQGDHASCRLIQNVHGNVHGNSSRSSWSDT